MAQDLTEIRKPPPRKRWEHSRRHRSRRGGGRYQRRLKACPRPFCVQKVANSATKCTEKGSRARDQVVLGAGDQLAELEAQPRLAAPDEDLSSQGRAPLADAAVADEEVGRGVDREA